MSVRAHVREFCAVSEQRTARSRCALAFKGTKQVRSSRKKSAEHRNAYQRDQAIARALHARGFVTTDGRIMLVRGMPQIETLFKRLMRIRKLPSMVESPTPAELGFAVPCEGELTIRSLQTCSRALKRWELALDLEIRRLKPSKQRRKKIAGELGEIERLRERLSSWHQALRQLERRDDCEQSPYALLSADEQTLAELLKTHNLPPTLAWLARVVLWIGGHKTLQRFLVGIGPLLDLPVERDQIKELRSLFKSLQVLRKRSEAEYQVHLRLELYELIISASPQLVTAGKLSARPRGRSIREHCDHLLNACEELLAHYSHRSFGRAVCGLASLAICDGSRVALPGSYIRSLVESSTALGEGHPLKDCMQALFQYSKKPKYGKLLQTIEQLKWPLCYFELVEIGGLLEQGVSLPDIQWMQEQDLLGTIPIHKSNSIAWARQVVGRLKELQLQRSEIESVFYAVESTETRDAVLRLCRWCEPFLRESLPPRATDLIAKALLKQLLPTVKVLAADKKFRLWAAPAVPKEAAGSQYDHENFRSVAKWLRRIFAYQEIGESPPTIPKSLNRLVENPARRAKEWEYLHGLAERDVINPVQRLRLNNLQSTEVAACTFPRKKCGAPLRKVVFAWHWTHLRKLRVMPLLVIGTATWAFHCRRSSAWLGQETSRNG